MRDTCRAARHSIRAALERQRGFGVRRRENGWERVPMVLPFGSSPGAQQEHNGEKQNTHVAPIMSHFTAQPHRSTFPISCGSLVYPIDHK